MSWKTLYIAPIYYINICDSGFLMLLMLFYAVLLREKTWAKYKLYMYWKDWQKCMKKDKMQLKYKKKKLTLTVSSLPVP